MNKLNTYLRHPFLITALWVAYLIYFIDRGFQAFMLIVNFLASGKTISEFLINMNTVVPGTTLSFILLFADVIFLGFLFFICFKRKRAALQLVPLLGVLQYLMQILFLVFVSLRQENISLIFSNEPVFSILGLLTAQISNLIPTIIATIIVYKNKDKFVN
jgi:hypothetical protein